MIYSYKCDACAKLIDITKPVSDFDKQENCSDCGSILVRNYQSAKVHLYGTSVQHSYFSHAFGQVVKGSNHERQIAKDRKCIEVGNENPHKHCKFKRQEYDV